MERHTPALMLCGDANNHKGALPVSAASGGVCDSAVFRTTVMTCDTFAHALIKLAADMLHWLLHRVLRLRQHSMHVPCQFDQLK
jgi:hypothetical protein